VLDLSFVSADHGFVLASAKCPRASCLLVGETLDGAKSWTTRGVLPAGVHVRRLRFVTPTIGYVYDYELLMTVDGGRTWRPQPARGVTSLEGNRHDVIRVVGGCDGAPHVERSAPGSSRWTPVRGTVAPAENSNCPPELLRDGQSRVVVVGYGNSAMPEPRAWIGASADGGAHFSRLADPCDAHGGYALGVAIAPHDVVAAFCTSYRFDDLGDTAAWLTVSTDDGRHWGRARAWADALGPGTTQYFAGIAVASATRILVATSSPHVGHTSVSQDGGATWSDGEEIALPYDEAVIGFQDTVTARATSGETVFTTRDGGRTWRDDAVRLGLLTPH
jgi:hypothetical protein